MIRRRAPRRAVCIPLALTGLACAAAGTAQTPAPRDEPPPPAQAASAADPPRFDGSAGELDVSVPRVSDPGVRIDGRLDEDAWERAAVLVGFTRYEPTEGDPAAEPTEVLVFYSPEAIYFGVRAYDSDPAAIPAQLERRDQSIFDDDWIRITLDTFDDRRQAYLFYVNPLGIQTDGLWIEGGEGRRRGGPPVDMNPDFIWESDGRVTEDGWVAEIRIPYVSLQFEDRPEQAWGFNFAREVRRLGYKQSWAPLTANRSSTLEQSGRLTGLRGLAPGTLLELNPVMTGKRTGEETDGVFERGGVEPELGLDARYGVTRNLVLGATINPDFSQVEADADQITVNERFAIFFPEKRPFFLDGTEIFAGPNRLVHTRQVADPAAGAKLTGKVGGLNLGYLGAVDESPRSLDEPRDRALFNLARLRADVGAGSAIGLLYTDRSLLDGSAYNRVAAADARLLFAGRYSLTAQVAGSWTRDDVIDEGEADEPVRGFGALWSASLQQSGRRFSWQVTVEDVAPDFRTETGFIRRVGDMRAFASAQVSFFTAPGSTLEQVGIEGRFEGFLDHADFWDGEERSPFEREIELQAELAFRGGRSIDFIARNGYFRFEPEEYADYEVLAADGTLEPFRVPEPLASLWAGGLLGNARVSSALELNGRFFLREVPIYEEAARGLEVVFGPSVTVRPTSALSLDLSYELSRLWRQRDGGTEFFSSADIPRLRARYQFSKALYARVILQYDLASRAPLEDPRTGRTLVVESEMSTEVDRGRFLSQLLLSYEPSPRTVFFVGWSRQEEGARALALGEMDPIVEGLFAKLSYLYRF